MTRYLSTAVTLVCTTLLCSFATAAVHTNASATFSDVQFGVVDLTPNDGIAAGFEFGARTSFFEASLTNGDYHDFNRFEPNFPVPVNAQASFFGYSATAMTNGQLANMHTAVDTGPLQRDGDSVTAWAGQGVPVLLKAHSAFTVSGRADAFVQTSDPALPILPGRLSLSLYVSYASVDLPAQFFRQELELGNGGSFVSYSDTFSMFLRNDFDHDIELYVNVGSSASVIADVSAVPEPATYLMLGAGLLALGIRRRFMQRAQ